MLSYIPTIYTTRYSIAVKTVNVNYDIVEQRARFQRHGSLIPSLRRNQAYCLQYSKNALLVAFSTAAQFQIPSSFLRMPLPANMQEVVKMIRGCVARKISTSRAQVNAKRL